MGVPIVEPEVSLDGDHDIETCKEVTRKVWKMQYEVLQQYGVMMEGMLFKPAMIVPGADAPKESAEKVAKYTLDVSFSFARALQSSVLKTWGGKKENEQKMQEMLRAICQVNGLAQMGKYSGELAARGHPSTTGSLYEKGYQY